MKLHYPVKPWKVTQRFGENKNNSYSASGLLGHTGIDVVAPYDTPIYSAVVAPIFRYINFGAPVRAYRALYQVVDFPDRSLEISYGHCNRKLDGTGTDTSPICTMGNSGDVYSDGVYVNPEVRDKPPHPGTHLHFQVRELVKDGSYNMSAPDQNGKARQYIYHSDGTPFMRNGFFYRITDYWNGYNGCIDPEPFFSGEYAQDQETMSLQYKIIAIINQLIALLKK